MYQASVGFPFAGKWVSNAKHLTFSFVDAKECLMRDFHDAKVMAHTLREALKIKSVSLTHSESLE